MNMRGISDNKPVLVCRYRLIYAALLSHYVHNSTIFLQLHSAFQHTSCSRLCVLSAGTDRLCFVSLGCFCVFRRSFFNRNFFFFFVGDMAVVVEDVVAAAVAMVPVGVVTLLIPLSSLTYGREVFGDFTVI